MSIFGHAWKKKEEKPTGETMKALVDETKKDIVVPEAPKEIVLMVKMLPNGAITGWALPNDARDLAWLLRFLNGICEPMIKHTCTETFNSAMQNMKRIQVVKAGSGVNPNHPALRR